MARFLCDVVADEPLACGPVRVDGVHIIEVRFAARLEDADELFAVGVAGGEGVQDVRVEQLSQFDGLVWAGSRGKFGPEPVLIPEPDAAGRVVLTGADAGGECCLVCGGEVVTSEDVAGLDLVGVDLESGPADELAASVLADEVRGEELVDLGNDLVERDDAMIETVAGSIGPGAS